MENADESTVIALPKNSETLDHTYSQVPISPASIRPSVSVTDTCQFVSLSWATAEPSRSTISSPRLVFVITVVSTITQCFPDVAILMDCPGISTCCPSESKRTTFTSLSRINWSISGPHSSRGIYSKSLHNT